MLTKPVSLRVERILAMSLIALVSSPAFVQPGERPRFEVAAVKPSLTDSPIAVRVLPGGRLVANAPIKLLIMNAFALQRPQIIGGPDWINKERYQIEAKSESSVDKKQWMLMLETLLEDRFRMSAHRENREMPAYALITDKKGSRVSVSEEGECAAGGSPISADRYNPPPFECRKMLISTSGAAVRMQGEHVAIRELVRVLAVALDRPVLDKTNLSGTFDIKLRYVDDDSGPAASTTVGPSLSIALQEQLGLKLEAVKSHIDVLVIDSIQRPTEN